MYSGMYFSILSFFYILLISFVYFSRKKIHSGETTIYSILVIVNILGIVTEFISTYLNMYVVGFQFIKDLSLRLIVISFFSWIFVISIYIHYISKEKLTKNNKIVYCIFYLIFLILFLVLPLHKNIVDGIITYTYGPCVYALYFSVALLFVMWTYVIIKYRKILKPKKYIPLVTFIVLGILVAFIQAMYPELLLEASLQTFITALMYFTIENPDVKMIQELEIAREQADKANRAKTDFLSSMSHEIRTPLNAIVGFSDCIIDSNTLDEAKENAKDIVNASKTLLEIVNGILDISKIEAGKVEIVNSQYNANELFLDLAKLITPKMKEKGLDFTYTIAPDLPSTLYGDHANLKKIVTNLLSNACKYTDKGYVHYEVNCVNSNNVSKLIISVEDSGRGIKKENIDKMFTKFQRLEEDRNTTIEGTGLGLAITKQLIELMGGRIIVHTVYGEGSKFTVVLNQKIEQAEIQETKKVKNTLDLHDVSILIVDDTQLNLKVATKLLEKFNANKIECVDSGFACLEKVRSGNKYDLILLDDMMPKMSGVETLKILKDIPGYKTPTIALTANAITGMREKYLADGFDDYLAKPIDREQLILVVNQILGRSITEELDLPVADNSGNEENNEEILSDEAVEQLEDVSEIKPIELIPIVDIDVATKPLEKVEVYDRSYLESNGADIIHALELLGDMDMYNMTINDFYSEVQDKWNKIIEYKNSGDMPNYAIEVHSLKSDCKYLGFMKLADISYQHELKSKDNDWDYVRENFPSLELEYRRVLEVVKNYVENNPVDE